MSYTKARTMQHAIQIPKPCNEPWEQMTPNGNGRRCAQCCKTVVDFTSWETQDILQYLQQQGPAKTCGRFTKQQVTPVVPVDFVYKVTRSSAPIYSKLAALFLLAFGFLQISCNTEQGKTTLTRTTGEVTISAPPPVDSLNRHVLGTPPIIVQDKKSVKKHAKHAA